jgi:tetratricopeptide (TPR) repeat protein
MKRQSPQALSYSWLYYIIPPSILAAITAIIYYPSLNYEFQFDDIANITKHFNIRHNTLSSLKFTGTRWISYWLNSIYYSIGKFNPYAYRVGNVIIHTSNGILVFLILFTALCQLKKESFFKQYAFVISFLSALLFLLHPVQTQTVSYVIQGELEGLAALTILSMVFCLLKMCSAKSDTNRYLLLGLLFGLTALSCGTKEIAIISPALLVIFDWFFIAQGDWKDFRKRIWIYALLSIFIIGLYLILIKSAFFTKIFEYKKNNIGNVITDDPNAMITPWSFFISQFKVLLHYLWIFIWPFNISVEYDWVLAKGFFAPDCIIPLIVLLCIAWGICKLLIKHNAHLVAFGSMWFFACMAPRSSFIPSPELLVDYKTYMASFGYLFLLSSGLIYLFVKSAKYYKKFPLLANQHYGAVFASLILALPIGLYTVQRNKVWRSGLEFWENIIQNAPGKARGYNNYAVELSQKLHKFEDAIPYFQKAIAMDRKYADPCNNLAVAYSHIGKIDQAIDALKQGLSINPTYPEGYNNLASFLILKRDYVQAEKMLNIALKLRPHYGKAFFNMGRIYLEKGNQEKAWECFKNSCTKADLDTDIGFATYAKVSLALKKTEDAIFGYKKTLELNPQYPEAKFNLANAYFIAMQYEQAIAMYQEVLGENPNELRAFYNQGEAYFKLNQPQKAIDCFNRSEKIRGEMPQLPIRIAACLEKMGKRQQAITKLYDILNDAKAPENLKQLAKNLIAQMENQSMKVKTA